MKGVNYCVLTGERQKCRNNLCDSTAKKGIAYCCPACGWADEKKYSIHESGILGHSDRCKEIHKDYLETLKTCGFE